MNAADFRPTSGEEMKRIRGEQIQSTVGQYLKRRHFMESVDVSPHKRELKGSQRLQQVALYGAVAWQGGAGNTISYSSISGDVTACDQQFVRLRSFIQEAIEPYRSWLQPLLQPIFVHIFLELICNGQKTPAHKFFSRHNGMFQDEEQERELMEELSDIYSRDDIETSENARAFRQNKYEIKLSQDCLSYLFRYLKTDDNLLMLQMFNQHVHIKINDEDGEDAQQEDDELADKLTFLSPPATPENKVIRNEVTLSSLQTCIRKVREGPACLASICFYTFLNTYQGLCSVSTSHSHKTVAASFEDSTIKLWSLTPGTFHTQPSSVNISHINLAYDYIEDVEERQRKSPEEEVVTLKGHSGAIYKTCFSGDDEYLLSASEDSTIRLWDLKTHTNKAVYRGHNYPVWDIDASPLNSYFVSCSHDRTAKLWTTDLVYPIRTFVGHVQDVDCVRFHPNGTYVATGSGDKTVRLWTVQDGQPVRLFQGHRATIHALAFSPNGQYLASAGEDRRVKVWDLSSGTLLKDLRGHTDTVYALAFSRDSSMLASGGLDCMLRVWDIRKTPADTPTGDGHISPELLGAFTTRSTTVLYLHYAQYNLLYAAGSFAS